MQVTLVLYQYFAHSLNVCSTVQKIFEVAASTLLGPVLVINSLGQHVTVAYYKQVNLASLFHLEYIKGNSEYFPQLEQKGFSVLQSSASS